MRSTHSLVDEAMAEVETLTPQRAALLQAQGQALLLDLREAAELRSEGRLPGALHVPRGLLEFQADPASPWHLPALKPGRPWVLFCGAGWRSALATRDLLRLGHANVSHIGGGFAAWKAAGLPVEGEPAMPDLTQSLRIQAHANRLANHRLHTAMHVLGRDELHAPRTGFFPTLIGTLNHILAVDGYYLACLQGERTADRHWHEFVPAADLAELQPRQHAADDALIHFCNGLDAAGCAQVVAMPRAGGRFQQDLACHVLNHLFMHQTHHRGQVHAMLSGTAVKPPQLDEFLMPSEAQLRHGDVQAHGWSEAAIWGLPPR